MEGSDMCVAVVNLGFCLSEVNEAAVLCRIWLQ
jgi:hypothetical protein